MESKKKVFIDLTKLKKNEIQSIYKIIDEYGDQICAETQEDLLDGAVSENYNYLFFDGESWNQNDYMLNNRKEINLSQFKALFTYSVMMDNSKEIKDAIMLLQSEGYIITKP